VANCWALQIDWVAAGAFAQALAAALGAGAVVFAAIVGSSTYKTWLKQKQTERKLHAAEQVLTIAYKARAAIKEVRSPFSAAYELERAKAKLIEAHGDDLNALPKEKFDRFVSSQSIYSRIEAHSDLWEEIYAGMALAFVLLDSSVEASLEQLTRQVGKVQVAAQIYPEAMNTPDDELLPKLRKDIWAMATPGDDQIGLAVDEAVRSIEAAVRPLLHAEK
jgi:hypothetical protein